MSGRATSLNLMWCATPAGFPWECNLSKLAHLVGFGGGADRVDHGQRKKEKRKKKGVKKEEAKVPALEDFSQPSSRQHLNNYMMHAYVLSMCHDELAV